jgi:glutamine synthetase
MTWQQLDMLPIIEEIIDHLAEIDIHLPQFHSEAAPGQWEFPLPALEPVKSVDVLNKTKDVIRNVAKKHGLKATCYPRPYSFTCGSANHAHFSINGPGDTVEKYEAPFLAGILEHLPALMAFTLPVEESYQRVNAGIWSGGEYVCWGTQNKEVPLRKCGPGHFELKTIDGMGNSYLSMAALLAAGLHGLRQDLKLEHKDCFGDPTGIGETERQKLGITTQLPNTLEKSLRALDRDKVLRRGLGYAVVDDYLAVGESLMAKLRGFGDVKRRLWLMARY